MHHILRTFSDEDADKIAVITAGATKDNVVSATARKASNPPEGVTALRSVFLLFLNIPLHLY
ncbi:hypothetical protein DL122_25965 [Salmonella enterica subsp. salamae]|uniref:Uncharacterized protein n=6 Tax=Salmonella enterica TaxID=28901 RepID=A0A6C7D1X5_SALER|nr:hypothetical protein DOE57_05795 [Salmonella enterica subsp. salamae serovar 56:b:[1,5]]EAA4438304.1 hypothetical protein [Salmonella enterica subsp. salamae]EAM5461174.1 hypothetical protein [Salmonella enterica]ECC2865860.1 hypothetical protein [Salmonella enterica subsp. enterica]ESE66086.1 hypothetical protein SES60163_07779 [Salmonella enterica subsp. salamae serovar 58:l,z13,z28:z6 str. 00-0163]HAC6414960.1 hypothetical protein [Salmonella enterica subsp. salamae serovar 58:a:-]HAC65